MTRREFERFRLYIQRQQLEVEPGDPIRYAVARCEFRRKQLQQLIAAGRTVPDSKTVLTKVQRWERQLERLKRVPARIASDLGHDNGIAISTAIIPVPPRQVMFAVDGADPISKPGGEP